MLGSRVKRLRPGSSFPTNSQLAPNFQVDVPGRVFCLCYLAAVVLMGAVVHTPQVYGAYGELDLDFQDARTRKPLSVRLHLVGPKGRPPRIRGYPAWHDHLAAPGKVSLKLPPGNYTFEVERGLEYRDVRGNFVIQSGATDRKTIALERIVDMAAEGWYSGDAFLQREPKDMLAVMLAEDLHAAVGFDPPDSKARASGTAKRGKTDQLGPTGEFPVDRWYRPHQRYDAGPGGRLGLISTKLRPPAKPGGPRSHSSAAFLWSAKRTDPSTYAVAIDDAAKDLPLWLASGRLDALMVLGPIVLRNRMAPVPDGWRSRDEVLFPGRLGNGLWVEFIYYQALNAGLRITPVAGSGSGLVPNPAGQNRVYARIRGEPTWDSWLRALRGGQVLVTNGPLMTPSVNGELPGHTFKASAGQTVSLQASLALYTREKIAYFELIRDGRVVESVPLEQWVGDRGRLPKVEFERSGWMMLRAVTNNKQTLRYVSTGPYYVEIGGQPAISRRAADFFLDWTRDRTQTIRHGDADDQAELLRDHRSAIQFWERRRELANLD